MSMKIITINIPDQYLDCIESMVNMGYFPSRSEALRQAVKQFLICEPELNHDLTLDQFQSLIKARLEGTLMIQGGVK